MTKIAYSKKTGKPVTFDELKKIAPEYDKVRKKISVDEFFDIHCYAVERYD